MHTIEDALEALASGLPVLVADDEGRENEGDLIVAGEWATADVVNLLITEGRGLVCAALPPPRARALGLEVDRSGTTAALHGTAFTASVDYVHGTTTGISCEDRSATLRALADPTSQPADFARPGHVFPLVAHPDGVLGRRGHTEATVDLCRLAGLSGVGVLCEVLNPDGTMARGPELQAMARRLGIPFLTVEALVRHRARTENPLRPLSTVALPTSRGSFDLTLFAAPAGGRPLALSRPPRGVPLVRIHSECCTGDLWGSLRCDCGPQLHEALDRVAVEGGAVIYLRQEGRGIGLEAKLKAYALQDEGLDTVEANLALGLPVDDRGYDEAAWMLRHWGWDEVRLLTNNPDKVRALEQAGIRVYPEALVVGQAAENQRYQQTKRDRLGHRALQEKT